MKKTSILVVVVLVAILLPAVASAGRGTGACYALGVTDLVQSPLGEGFTALCLDDVTQEQCAELNLGGESSWSRASPATSSRFPGTEAAWSTSEAQLDWAVSTCTTRTNLGSLS